MLWQLAPSFLPDHIEAEEEDCEGGDVVSVRWTLTMGGYSACAASALFCIVLVLLPPGPMNEFGGLRYISEGMDVYCGWSAVVLGTCCLLLLLCQLAAATHLAEWSIFWALLQAIGWNVVLGVVDTGWTAHYVGLACFLLGSFMYHRIAGSDATYGGPFYRVCNALTALLALIFMCAAIMSKLSGPEHAMLRSLAVIAEFLLMGTLTVQNACLVAGLDQFHDIHLRFTRRSAGCTGGSGR